MKKKLAAAKDFVQTHKTKIAVTAGVVIGAVAVHASYDRLTLLHVTEADAAKLQLDGGALLYQTEHGDMYLNMAPITD